MKWPALASAVLVTALAMAAEPARAQAAPPPDDRLIFGANGSRLTGGIGGGAAATWLHDFSAGNLVGVGTEYQTIANSHWTLGSIIGAVALQ